LVILLQKKKANKKGGKEVLPQNSKEKKTEGNKGRKKGQREQILFNISFFSQERKKTFVFCREGGNYGVRQSQAEKKGK